MAFMSHVRSLRTQKGAGSTFPRLMLGEMLLRVRGLHPQVLGEFVQPLRLLNERHPFPDAEAAGLLNAQQSAALGTESTQSDARA